MTAIAVCKACNKKFYTRNELCEHLKEDEEHRRVMNEYVAWRDPEKVAEVMEVDEEEEFLYG